MKTYTHYKLHLNPNSIMYARIVDYPSNLGSFELSKNSNSVVFSYKDEEGKKSTATVCSLGNNVKFVDSTIATRIQMLLQAYKDYSIEELEKILRKVNEN